VSVVRWILHRDRAEHDLHEELQAFVDMAAADRMRDGAAPADARRSAALHLGGMEQAKERVRVGRHGAWLDEVGRDLRYGVRTLRRSPAFTAVALLTLALGIGANTAIFSILRNVILRPLGYPGPEQLMNTPFSLVLGMTYTYLPFMILPLYSNLSKMDLRLLEAAADLGATAWVAFWKITVPLSKAGIVAGSMLVFIPCVGEYVIPELLGGPQTQMIGRTLWDEFFSNNDWPMAATVAVAMVLLIIVPLALFNKVEAETLEARR